MYWRVSLTAGDSIDVEADSVNIDGHNNLRFMVFVNEDTQIANPEVVIHRGEWRAYRRIDQMGGKPLYTEPASFDYVYVTKPKD